MSTDEQAPVQPEPPAAGPGASAPPSRAGWRDRDHPTFTALAAFFAGLVLVVVVPGTYAALLRLVVDQETAEDLFPLALLALVVPLVLAFVPRTRRVGRYLLLGMVSTAVVVLGSAALVLWILYRTEG
ncbi:hypothetical protein GHK92_17465 [Nocardioides sp. dk4132]|uniref:hypothetical protein n=1 Tax=unclassified Nocardioides TaxID=2615069 RepID=UPI0012973B8F|nr:MULTISPECIES: hypothetical protein [unclassified Nocardioides]MQW77663.1 hypothetical protein [Nocardioides sp. dk4132]